jgi:hypothetical protein
MASQRSRLIDGSGGNTKGISDEAATVSSQQLSRFETYLTETGREISARSDERRLFHGLGRLTRERNEALEVVEKGPVNAKRQGHRLAIRSALK